MITLLTILTMLVGIGIFRYWDTKQEQKYIQEIDAKIDGGLYAELADDCNYENAVMQTCCVGSVYDMQQLGGFLSTSDMCDGTQINTPECPGAYNWCVPQKTDDAKSISENNKSCTVDEDCVPATCCHATEVVNKEFAPDCEGMMCTMSCETVLDCGQGEPVCNDRICEINILRESGEVIY